MTTTKKPLRTAAIKIMSASERKAPVPKGILVIIGGKENKGESEAPERENPGGFMPLEILKVYSGLLPKQNASIWIVTSGSAEGAESFADYKRVFDKLGHHKIKHIHHDTREEVLKDKDLESIVKADGIFFAGGNQLLLTGLYGGSSFLTVLKQKYIAEKFIVGGTSAGAMAMSTPMIYAGEEKEQQISGQIKITTGLEFLKDVCIDTHFVHRSRFIRLAQVIGTNPGCLGLGIEEDTAVIVRNGSECEVCGSGSVIQLNGLEISLANMANFTDKKAFSVKNLKVDILAAGDKFELQKTNPPHN